MALRGRPNYPDTKCCITVHDEWLDEMESGVLLVALIGLYVPEYPQHVSTNVLASPNLDICRQATLRASNTCLQCISIPCICYAVVHTAFEHLIRPSDVSRQNSTRPHIGWPPRIPPHFLYPSQAIPMAPALCDVRPPSTATTSALTYLR